MRTSLSFGSSVLHQKIIFITKHIQYAYRYRALVFTLFAVRKRWIIFYTLQYILAAVCSGIEIHATRSEMLPFISFQFTEMFLRVESHKRGTNTISSAFSLYRYLLEKKSSETIVSIKPIVFISVAVSFEMNVHVRYLTILFDRLRIADSILNIRKFVFSLIL